MKLTNPLLRIDYLESLGFTAEQIQALRRGEDVDIENESVDNKTQEEDD